LINVAEVFAELLLEHPAARLSAVSADGTPVPVPSDVPIDPRHTVTGTAGMTAYQVQDRPTLIDVFERCVHDGQACGDVHLVHEPSLTLTVHMFDTIEQYGVIMVVGNQAVSRVLHNPPGAHARLARVYKSRTAEILGIDQAITDILGYTTEEMVGKRSLEFIHPDDQGLAIESWAVLVTEPDAIRRVRLRHRSSEGSWIWFDVAHSASSWQGTPCFVTDMIDVSKEMETQRALEAREQLLAQLAEALPLGVFQIDATQHFLYTNDCLFAMMGTTDATDFAGLLRWVSPDDNQALQHALRRVLSDGADTEVTVHVELPDRGALACQFTLRQLTSAGDLRPGAVGCVADITEQTTLRRELEDRATFDPLTRCYNRASIMSLLDQILAEPAGLAPSDTAVLFIDLDGFKAVNDRFGHHIGDEFLAATAARIRGALRDGGVLGRLGGDEFLVIVPNIRTSAQAATIAQRIAHSLQEDIALSIGTQPARASVGLAIQDHDTTTAEALVNRADTAMYDAKARGGNQVSTAGSNGHYQPIKPLTRQTAPSNSTRGR
jgi:diguanylate cyclase (GGDEF)-like protein/PAS domain S-box-containing protein